MNTIPFLNLPLEYSWGTKYYQLLDYYTSRKIVIFERKSGILSTESMIGLEDEWEKIRFKAYLMFGRILKKLNHCTLIIPHDISKFDSADFVRTYNILINKLGKPTIQKGMTTIELEKHENYFAVRPEELPYFEWSFDSCILKHRFIDHWGNGPKTTLEPNRKR